MKFGTVINCTDGRVQYPVMDYLKKHYESDFFDSANNPGDRAFQENQVDEALDYLQRSFGTSITYVGLYVNEQWEVEEYTRLKPGEQD